MSARPLIRHRAQGSHRVLALLIAAGLGQAGSTAQAQGFAGTPTVASGAATISASGSTQTVQLINGNPQTIINWAPTDTATSTNPINFLPAGQTVAYLTPAGQSAAYTVLNRIIPTDTSRSIGINGTITSSSNVRVWFYSPGGFLIGANAVFNVGGLVLSAADPVTTTNPASGQTTFVNSTSGSDSFVVNGAAGSQSAITIQPGAQINVTGATGQSTYMVAIAPQISNGGTINVAGSTALVAAESASFAIDPQGLFTIAVSSGSTVSSNTLVNTGSVGSSDSVADNAAQVRRVYMVAVPKNNAVTMAISAGGTIGFAPAGAAAMVGNQIVLSAGEDIADSANGVTATPSAGGTGAASLTLGGGTYSSNLTAFSTGSIAVTDPARSITFGSSASFAAPQVAITAATGTISVAGDLAAVADNVGFGSGFTASVTANAGAALNVGTAAAALGVQGNLTISANDAYHGTAGSAALSANGGSVAIAGNLAISANGSWDNAPQFSNPGGLATQGGSANLTASGGGTVLISGSAAITATADASNASFAYVQGQFGLPDTAINAYGGQIAITATGAGSAITTNGALFAAAASAKGSGDPFVAAGGNAVGGEVTIGTSAGGAITFAAATALTVDASAAAGNAPDTAGGTASGGVINLAANSGTISFAGPPSITLSATAVGGNGSDAGGAGGAAFGGSIQLETLGSGSVVSNTSGSGTAGSGAVFDVAASGGIAGAGGIGGAANGGSATIKLTGSGQQIQFLGTIGGVTLDAAASGGNGSGGGGGQATGGTAALTMTGGTMTVNGGLTQVTNAIGGSDDTAGNGGSAIGGTITETLSGGASLAATARDYGASATGGGGYILGGAALGGNVLVSVAGGLTPPATTIDTSYVAGIGAANDTPGSAASAGGARFEVGGTVTIAKPITLVGNSSLEINAGGSITVKGAIIGTGADAYLRLWADDQASGIGTVSLGAGAINLSGSGAAVDIDYNPVALGTPTNYAPGVAAGTLTAYQLVDSVTQLQAIGSYPTQNFALGQNIDATATQGWNSGAGFVPIGTLATPFSGNFDGLNHTITGLFINTPTSDFVGLFGVVGAATGTSITIRNVGLVNPVISGGNYTGGLIGAIPGIGGKGIPVALTNDFVTGSYGSISGTSYVGGLLGDSEQPGGVAVSGSHADVAVSANGYAVGGLAGQIAYGTVTNVFATGAVVDPFNGASSVGGLIGETAATVTQAYATGAVTVGANAQNIGGLIGSTGNTAQTSGAVTYAYATGAVTTGSGASNVGGLIGSTYLQGTEVDQTWASGAITTGSGSTSIGGLVGNNANAAGSISNSYWDSYSTGQAVAVGGGTTGSNVYNVSAVTSDPTQTLAANYALNPQSYGNLNPAGWIFDTAAAVSNATRPIGAWEMPVAQYLVAPVFSAHQVQLIERNPAGNYQLTQSIDMGGTAAASDIWGGAGFIPIALNGPLTGTLDGAGHVLTNLTYAIENVEVVGLVANNAGTIENIGIWNATINSPTGTAAQAGLLVAQNSGTITGSFATGTIIAPDSISGGLVGYNSGTITNSYATVAVGGNATGQVQNAGGLVGQNYGTISGSYANGPVSGSLAGGLVGFAGAGAITASYWDTQISGQALACSAMSSVSCGGATGLTTAQTQQSSSFAGFAIDTSGGQGLTWRQYNGQTTPMLDAFLQTITVQPGSLTMVYDAAAPSLGVTTYGANAALLSGTAQVGGLNRNAGTYTISYTGGLYSSQLGYDLVASETPGQLVITPAPLTLTAATQTKVYDATTSSTGQVQISGLQGTDSVTALTQSYDSANAGNRTLSVNSGFVISDGNGGNNYTVSTVTAAGSITPAPLTLTATTQTKVYDATTNSTGQVQITGLQGQDSVTALTQSYDSANAGNRTLSVNSGFVINDGNDGGNYTVSTVTAAGSITPAPLTLTATTQTKVYDATTSSTGQVQISGLQGQDSVTALTQSYNSANAGNRTLSVNPGFVINDGNDGGNYTVSTVTAAGSITPAPLTLTATTQTKVYDATTSSTGQVQISGLQGQDSVTALTQSYDSVNAGNRTLSVNPGFVINDGNEGGNYTVTTVTAPGSITPAALTLTYTASAISSIYGDAISALSGMTSVSGLKGDDSAASVLTGTAQFTTTATAQSGIGSYAVIGSGLSLATGNYTLRVNQSESSAIALTILPRPLDVIAQPQQRPFGEPNPPLTYIVTGPNGATGLVNGDQLSGALATGATLTSPVGTYAITQGTLTASPNYTITYTPALLTVSIAIDTVLGPVISTDPGLPGGSGEPPGDPRKRNPRDPVIAAIRGALLPAWVPGQVVDDHPVQQPVDITEPVGIKGDPAQWGTGPRP